MIYLPAGSEFRLLPQLAISVFCTAATCCLFCGVIVDTELGSDLDINLSYEFGFQVFTTKCILSFAVVHFQPSLKAQTHLMFRAFKEQSLSWFYLMSVWKGSGGLQLLLIWLGVCHSLLLVARNSWLMASPLCHWPHWSMQVHCHLGLSSHLSAAAVVPWWRQAIWTQQLPLPDWFHVQNTP